MLRDSKVHRSGRHSPGMKTPEKIEIADTGEGSAESLMAPGGAQAEANDPDVPPLQWGACPDAGQECATLRVPLDYRAPAGREIDVAISRVKSTAPGARRGVLLLNPVAVDDDRFGSDWLRLRREAASQEGRGGEQQAKTSGELSGRGTLLASWA